jgi:hypothetical protein
MDTKTASTYLIPHSHHKCIRDIPQSCHELYYNQTKHFLNYSNSAAPISRALVSFFGKFSVFDSSLIFLHELSN